MIIGFSRVKLDASSKIYGRGPSVCGRARRPSRPESFKGLLLLTATKPRRIAAECTSEWLGVGRRLTVLADQTWPDRAESTQWASRTHVSPKLP